MATIGLGTSIGGPIDAGIAQMQASQYQAKVASNNAIIAKQNAAYAASAGAAQAEQAGLKARSQAANVRAGEAAAGVDVNTGSAADVQTGQREIGALDTQTVSNNAALEAYGYQTQAANFRSQVSMDHYAGDYALEAGFTNAAAAAAGGAPSMPINLQSQLSGPPSFPDSHAWMLSSDNTVEDKPW